MMTRLNPLRRNALARWPAALGRWWWCVLFALLALQPLPAAVGTPFDAANQLYDQGKFDDARQQYEKLADAGSRSANLYFNLGNAEYRLGERGKAILDYERALALQPDHPEAQANLKLARDQTGARLIPPSLLEKVILPWPANHYVILAAAAFWIAVFCALGLWIWRRTDGLLLWAGLVLAVLAGGYAGAALWQDGEQRALGIVTAREVAARLSPADRAGIAETLQAGSRVYILSERGDWVYCGLPGEGRGWVPAGTVERVRPAS